MQKMSHVDALKYCQQLARDVARSEPERIAGIAAALQPHGWRVESALPGLVNVVRDKTFSFWIFLMWLAVGGVLGVAFPPFFSAPVLYILYFFVRKSPRGIYMLPAATRAAEVSPSTAKLPA